MGLHVPSPINFIFILIRSTHQFPLELLHRFKYLQCVKWSSDVQINPLKKRTCLTYDPKHKDKLDGATGKTFCIKASYRYIYISIRYISILWRMTANSYDMILRTSLGKPKISEIIALEIYFLNDKNYQRDASARSGLYLPSSSFLPPLLPTSQCWQSIQNHVTRLLAVQQPLKYQ